MHSMRSSPLLASPCLPARPPSPQPIPRTPDGRPDLHGYWFSGFLTPLERPDGVTGLVVPARRSRPP